MERFLAAGTDGWILLIAGGTVQPVIAVCERSVDQISFTLGAYEAFLVPVFVLETNVLYVMTVNNLTRVYHRGLYTGSSTIETQHS